MTGEGDKQRDVPRRPRRGSAGERDRAFRRNWRAKRSKRCRWRDELAAETTMGRGRVPGGGLRSLLSTICSAQPWTRDGREQLSDLEKSACSGCAKALPIKIGREACRKRVCQDV